MPGVVLDLDLPAASDTMADFRAKLVVALEAIAADLEPRITAGQLDITTALSIGGAPLYNVGGLRLVGGESTVAGTLYIGDDDELYVHTEAGAVQITLNGALDISSLGTIGGDFGGVNPAAVTYDDLSGEFRFTESPGQWADLVADDVVLRGANGTVRLGLHPTFGTSSSFLFSSLPTVGIGGLAYDSSTSSLVDASSIRETAEHLFTDIDVDGTATIADADIEVLRHGAQVIVHPLTLFNAGHTDGPITSTNSPPGSAYVEIGAAGEARWPLYGLRAGNQVNKITITGLAEGITPVIVLYHQQYTATVALPHTVTAGNFGVDGYVEMTLDTPYLMTALDCFWVSILGGTVNVAQAIIAYETP